MKKLLKKLTTGILSLTVLASVGVCGTACGGSDNGELVIGVVKLGYGTDWLYALKDAFEAKTGNSVTIDARIGQNGQNGFDTAIESKSTGIDIFFTKRAWFASDVYKGKITVKGNSYACLYEDLTDVWDSVAAEGESKTIKEKMDPLYVDALNIGGKYYNLPWVGGVYGLVRNVSVWNQLGLTDEDMPYTTNELFALCDQVKTQKAPFIYCSDDEYYSGWSPIFFGQYEGAENVKSFMEGKDPDGNVSQYVYTYQGHVEAMKVLETLLDPDNGYQHAATSVDFTTMQGYFLTGEALFCVNGAWLENEMSANYRGANVDMIKTPVISALVEKLSFETGNAVADDAKLKEVIKYVDEVDAGESPVKPEGVTDEDIKIVTEARHYSYMAGGVDHRAYVPSYSEQIPLAKEFLKFMYSDEGMNIYYRALKGAMLPAECTSGYNSEGMELTGFRISANKAAQEGFVYNREPKSRFFVLNSLSTCYQIGGIEPVDEFASVNGRTAQGVMNAIDEYLNSKWTKFEENI